MNCNFKKNDTGLIPEDRDIAFIIILILKDKQPDRFLLFNSTFPPKI